MGTKTPLEKVLNEHNKISCEKRIPKHGDENLIR